MLMEFVMNISFHNLKFKISKTQCTNIFMIWVNSAVLNVVHIVYFDTTHH